MVFGGSFANLTGATAPDGAAHTFGYGDAATLSLETIAEGIEGADQLDELRSAGCRSGQGYLFARPLQADALEAFLDTADTEGSVDART